MLVPISSAMDAYSFRVAIGSRLSNWGIRPFFKGLTHKLFNEIFLTANGSFEVIGSYTPEMQEVDPLLLHPLSPYYFGQGIIVDSLESCLLEAGEIIAAGSMYGKHNLSICELGKVWQATTKADCGAHMMMVGNVFYKSVGTGAMDLAAATELVRIAAGSKTGIDIEGF